MLRHLLFAPLHPRVLRPAIALGRSAGLLPATRSSAGTEPQSILVANLTTYLGDGVMMMPFLSRLRERFPEARIDLATTSANAPLFRQLTWLHRVHALPAPVTNIPVWSTYRRMLQMAELARAIPAGTGFDLCLLPRWGTDPGLSAWFALFAGAREVYGYDPGEDTYGHSTVPGVQSILTRTATGGLALQEAMRELRLLETTGLTGPMNYDTEKRVPVKPLREIGRTIDLAALKERLGLPSSAGCIALAPGASSSARRWPSDHFAALSQRYFDATGQQSIVLGGPADAAIGAAIEDAAPGAAINLAGKTSLPETIALLSAATLLVANDSGPGHLGGGIGTPTLVLSACPSGSVHEHAGSPARVAPVGPVVRVLQPASGGAQCEEQCTSESAHCILGLSVDYVLQNAREVSALSASYPITG